MISLSVVMPAYDNLDVLAVSLPAILRQTLPPSLAYEVVLVDDGSGAATAAWIARQSDPRLHVITHPANRGRSAARNAGFRASRGAVVVFLDSDVIVGPDFLAQHAAAIGLGAGDEVGARISLGRVVDTGRLAGPEAQRQPPPRPSLVKFTAANVAIARSVLKQVQETPQGPFDEATFTGYGWEDLELDLRLAGLEVQRETARAAIGFHYCPPFRYAILPGMIRKETDRARMARAFYRKHPRLTVRLITQRTPVHRALWELLTLGGLLNERSLAPLLSWLAGHGGEPVAAVLARNLILNPTYVRNL